MGGKRGDKRSETTCITIFPQYYPEGKLEMSVSEPGGREFKIVLEDSSYNVIWRGRIAHQHGGREVDCWSGGVIEG